MKKMLTAVAASLIFAFSASAATEGVEYQVLPVSAQFNAPNEVTKIYSINCPFCYKYDKAGIPNDNIVPAGSKLDQYHITTKPPFGVEKATGLAIAKIIKGDASFKTLKDAYYQQYHVKKSKFTDADTTVQFALDRLDMSRAQFDDYAKDPSVVALIAKWEQGVEVAKIQGIPAITVNGKYLINTKEIRSMDMLKSLIAELSAK
ncbi:thiol:disulfide interchange protein DsbA/DsbL [Shewanella sp. NIFS-20-20]|uniref:thiol:disulfide interchange protein DsbA/DsbL n=1 Tax=Shewanella sp. NIFS-20-20 TaxID=2853806 RepID=UPI001C440816|nr:thiol:disulfide interchange protein DsbA/DsbL [Shewanella sp. NIFS-20-20]MBV7317601.1 thiol:disulfide interchange protein DsbA/DsbL [Shewanella sp. NIFS-20-20]